MLAIDTDFVTRTLCRLVEINSVNPSLVAGAPGEAAIAAFTTGVLRELGLDVVQHESAPQRVTVVGRLRGKGGGRSLMLNAHYDTVGVDGMAAPFAATIRDGRLYGRGAYDMKGSLASCLGAVKALIDAGITLDGDLVVAAVADEEHASLGTQDVIRHHPVDGAIVTEPTALQICLAHKGFIWMEIETKGRAAHGSKPEFGVDANLRMGRVLARLAALEEALRDSAPHPLVGPPSVHAAMLHGGTGLSTYAANCRLHVERRTIPGETEVQVRAEMRALLDPLHAEDPRFEATLTHVLTRAPFETTKESVLVRALDHGVRVVRDAAPVYMGETPWMDAALLAAAGISTVVIGPDGGGAHAAEEWVDLQTVYDLAAILAQTAVEYCGTAAASQRPDG